VNDEVVRDAARSLLAGRFVEGPAAPAVRRHRRVLAELFRDEVGWQIVADDDGPVRALSTPGPGHVARGLTTRSGRRFDPQRYALLFLVLAALESAGARTTLQLLFADVRVRAGDVEALGFDDDAAASRRAFIHAVHAAVDLGVLEFAEGDEEDFVLSGGGDALYRVDRARLTRLLATSKPPSLTDSPAAAIAENLYASTDDGQRRRRRHRVIRALVSEPVVYRSDLSDAEVDYLTSQEPRLRRLLRDAFGLELEARAEGWVTVDTVGALSDLEFPSISAPRAAALAILDASRARRSDDGTAYWDEGEIVAFVGGLQTQFGTSWPVKEGDPDLAKKVAGIAADAADVLTAMRLAVPAPGGGITVLPAAGRFALVEEPTTEQAEISFGSEVDV